MKQINLNSDELKDFLKHIITNNQHLQSLNKKAVAVNVQGEAGIGKTTVIMDLGAELGLDVVKLNLAQLEEIGDLVGFPIKEYEVVSDTKGSRWIPESLLTTYIANKFKPTGEKRMSHATPDWINNKKEGGILILDDWTRADNRFIQAVMEIIDRQEYISWKLPKNWHIILTSNPDNGEYLVSSIDDAQKTRFINVNLKFDLDCWAKWAEAEQIDTRCINFLLMNPEITTEDKKFNAGSMTTFFNAISSFKNFETNLPMIQMIGEGSVGPEIATLFTLFINNNLDKLISPKEVLHNSDWAAVQQSLIECIGYGENYKASMASLMTTRIINYTLYHAQVSSVDSKFLSRVESLMLSDNIFSNDLSYYMIRSIVNGNKTKFQSLMLKDKIVKATIK
jgi:hypothetical protein